MKINPVVFNGSYNTGKILTILNTDTSKMVNEEQRKNYRDIMRSITKDRWIKGEQALIEARKIILEQHPELEGIPHRIEINA